MKSVFISPNMRKNGITAAVLETCEVLHRCGAQVILPVQAQSIGAENHDILYMSSKEAIARADFIISLGGDGTILRVARQAAIHRVPLLGVNVGHVGFMTELEREEIGLIQEVFEERYAIDSRMMLELSILRNGHAVYTYSLAAGGPIIEPSAENIAVTPICPHAMQAKSFVFSPEREIAVTASGLDGSAVCVSADGDGGMEVRPDDVVVVRRSKLDTQLIRIKGKSFYHILRKKLSDGGKMYEVPTAG